jgi:aryl-alcohol dehydrogenase-like predicted oxidoreductase
LGTQDDSDSIATIRRAVELGINWVDTAPLYGFGHSEEIVGQALSVFSAEERPFVFTKAGRKADPADTSKPPFAVLDERSIREELEVSLRRLGAERIDLYLIHAPAADGQGVEEYWNVLAALRQEGKVRAIGLSNHSVPQLEAAEAITHVEAIQPPLSAIKDEAVADLLPWCESHRTGVIVYSPMGGGLLAGEVTREVALNLAPNDWRRTNPIFSVGLDRSLRIADAVRAVAAEHGVSMPAVAIAWALAQPAVSGAILGGRRPEQIPDWFEAARVQLTADDFARIAAAAAESPAAPAV